MDVKAQRGDDLLRVTQLGAAHVPPLPSNLCTNLLLLGPRIPDCSLTHTHHSSTTVTTLSQGRLNSNAKIEVFHPRPPQGGFLAAGRMRRES